MGISHSAFGRLCLGALLWCVAAGALGATTLYKWVDADGVTHYSDTPEPGAQRVKIANAQTYKSTPTPANANRPPPSKPSGPAVGYTHLEVTNPADGAVIWNTGGRVEVGADLEPSLASGHQLWFVVDGKSQQGNPGGPTSIEVPRGEHTLTASVTDADGNELITSAPVSFVVRQNSAVAHPPEGPALQKPKP
jgi:hypothetical protein